MENHSNSENSNLTEAADNHCPGFTERESKVSRPGMALCRSALTLPIKHVARPARHTNVNRAFSGDDSTHPPDEEAAIDLNDDLQYYLVAQKSTNLDGSQVRSYDGFWCKFLGDSSQG